MPRLVRLGLRHGARFAPNEHVMQTKTRFSRWTPLMMTQFSGVLNDNLLKGAISFLVVQWVPAQQVPTILALSSILLVAPFLLFSALGGRLSNRFPKGKVVAWAKFAELPIMAVACLSLVMQHVPLALISLGFMGVQSALYGPSKMGLIAETADGAERSWGTGLMDGLAFGAVLLGMLLAGWMTGFENGSTYFAFAFMGLALVGWLATQKLRYKWPEQSAKPASANPIMFARHQWAATKQIKGLRGVLLANAAFWFVTGLMQLLLLVHLPERYALDTTQTGMLLGGMSLAIALGCVIAGKISGKRAELGLVPLAAIGMFFSLLIAGLADPSLPLFTACMLTLALCAGLFKVPLNAWMQSRIPTENLGPVLGFDRMLSFSGVAIASGLFAASAAIPTPFMILALALAVGVLAFILARQSFGPMIRLIVVMLGRTLFRFRIQGLQHIPTKKGALLVANHCSYLDFLLISTVVPRQVRFVMLRDVYENKWLKPILSRLNMIPISPRKGGNNLEQFNALVEAEVAAGHVVCIFAEGTVSRTGHMLMFRKGVEHLAERIAAPVIPIHFDNVNGSPFSYVSAARNMVKFKFSNMRQAISATVGSPEVKPVVASALRQRMVEMGADAFAQRPRPSRAINEQLFDSLRTGRFTITDSQRFRSSSDLLREALPLAMRLEQLPGDAIGIAYANNLNLHLALTAACFARKTVVPVSADLTAEQAQRILTLAGCKHVVTACETLKAWEPLSGIEFIHAELEHGRGSAHCLSHKLHMALTGWRPLPFPADRPLVRTPEDGKGKLELLDIYPDNVWALQTGLAQVSYTNEVKKVLTHLPGADSWGVLLPLMLAGQFRLDVVLASENELGSMVDEHRPDAALIHPSALTALLTDGPEDLSFLKQLHTGLSPIEAGVREGLEARGTHMFASAGLNRTSSILAVNMPDFKGDDMVGTPMYQRANHAGSVGKPLPGIAVRIVDPNNPEITLAPGQIGRVLVKGAAVAGQQLQRLAGQVENWIDGWEVTPLLGKVDEHGFLQVVPEL